MRSPLVLALLWFCAAGIAGAEEWKLLEPGMPILGQVGERVTVRFQGPPGEEPLLTLGSRRFSLNETVPGQYSGFFTIGERKQNLGLLAGGRRRELGSVDRDPGDRLFLALTESVTRQASMADYDRLTPLYRGTRVRLDGSRGRWHRAAGSGSWIDAGSGEVQKGYLPPNRLNRVLVEEAEDGDALLKFECLRPGEVQVRHSLVGERLTVRLEDTLQTCFDIKRPTGVAEFLGPILLRPESSGFVEVELSAQKFAGYQVEPTENGIVLRVRKPLPDTLNGLKITVDAGHGGPDDHGTVGHGGLMEKTLNLRVAKALQSRLEALGASVTMTRASDREVATDDDGAVGELQARIDRSIAAGAHLFLSIHHNARPSVEDGKVAHGTDVYWYQPHSQALAKSLADPIADAIVEDARSYRWRSFFVIRQTHSPAVLIEFQYLSNPLLEKTVLDQPDYPDKAAEAVIEGLQSYLKGLSK